MRIVLLVFILFCDVAWSKNQVEISDQMLLSGGQEMVLTGNPEVIIDNKKGQVFSGVTYWFRFADQSQRMHHRNNVRFESSQGLNVTGHEAVEHIDKLVHQMVFTDELVVHKATNSESASTTYRCQSKTLIKNGQIIQQKNVMLEKGVSLNCDANNNPILNFREYVFVPH